MAAKAPTRSQIRSAHRQAVGGGRKRCRKGKNCSAACIQQGMECLVEMPESAGVATTKVRNMLQQRLQGKMPAPAAPTAQSLGPNAEAQALRSQAKGILREMKPERAPVPSQPSTPAGGGQTWLGKFGGRTPALDEQLSALSEKINKLSPDQQAYWNEQINKQLNPKLASRNGTPYTPEKTNRSLTSQAKAWNYLVENGQPKELMNRIGEKRPAPKGMIPDVTSSGQRKWISPDDGLKYSLNRGNWRQNRVSKADTDRRLPDITNFRKEQQAAGSAWPTQKLPARADLPKSVNEIIRGLSSAEKNAIVFNGLDATGNEGIKLRAYYNANPAEKEARLKEIVQRWHDQGGRSGVSGKPVALPGMEPKKGEERSSVDHFQPISTNRAASLPASQMRKIADNYKNFLIAEEGPNSQRGARTWDSWLDRRESQGKPKEPKAPKAAKETATPKAAKATPKAAQDADYKNWSEINRGNYGRISASPDGTRAVKELLVGPDGVKGKFGPHEIELATRMGELGHSPKIYKTSNDAMEMDRVRGKPLWSGYRRGEGEPVMNAAQATQAAAAIRDLHKLGFAHGDNHALQYLVDGNNVKLVDYGLSVPLAGNPVKAMQDLSKMSNLTRFDNPELAGNPYVQVVNRHLPAYREVKGTSKAAVAEKERIAKAYLQDLENLQ